jgi:hypothetical protein
MKRNSKPTRVYILGAGASAPYGLPLLSTLTWELAETLTPRDRRLFVNTLRECFGRAPTGPRDSPDFEELLNRLDPRALRYLEDTASAKASDRQKAAELALTTLRSYIRDRCRARARRHGPYDRLVGSLDANTVLISFNWDVLLELAFRRAGRTFSYFPDSSDSSTLLLKPHGSINWFALLERHGIWIAPQSNVRPIGDLNNYLCYITEPLQRPKFGGRGTMLQASLATLPAIVPPAASKILSVGGVPGDGFVEAGHTRAMKQIWSTAASAVANAREIVIVGYSMPGTDAASIAILKHFRRRSRRRKQLFLVERDAAVADRYRTVLGVDAQIICTDFKNFDPSKRLPKRLTA